MMKRTFATLIFTAIAAILPAASASAGLVLTAPALDVAPGASGSFDLILTNGNPSGGDSYEIAADLLDLALVGPSGVQFTNVSIATTLPYLFAEPGVENGGGPFSFDAFPNSSFLASDAEFAIPGFALIAPGESYAVANVSFVVDPSAPAGVWTLSLGAGTSFLDSAGSLLPLELVEGTIRVSAVPEPSAGLLALIGLGSVVVARARRRRTA